MLLISKSELMSAKAKPNQAKQTLASALVNSVQNIVTIYNCLLLTKKKIPKMILDNRK